MHKVLAVRQYTNLKTISHSTLNTIESKGLMFVACYQSWSIQVKAKTNRRELQNSSNHSISHGYRLLIGGGHCQLQMLKIGACSRFKNGLQGY